jgi:hypothetical protein
LKKSGTALAMTSWRDSARSHVIRYDYPGQSEYGNHRENKPNMKEINDWSGNEKSQNIRHGPDTSEKIDDIDIHTVNPLIKIGIPQNFYHAGANAGCEKYKGPNQKTF